MKLDYYKRPGEERSTYYLERGECCLSNRIISRQYIKLERDITNLDFDKLKSIYEIKILDKETKLYELKFDKIRIIHFYFNGDIFVYLGTFLKKSRQTPKAEIEKNNNRLKDYKERENEQGPSKKI